MAKMPLIASQHVIITQCVIIYQLDLLCCFANIAHEYLCTGTYTLTSNANVELHVSYSRPVPSYRSSTFSRINQRRSTPAKEEVHHRGLVHHNLVGPSLFRPNLVRPIFVLLSTVHDLQLQILRIHYDIHVLQIQKIQCMSN